MCDLALRETSFSFQITKNEEIKFILIIATSRSTNYNRYKSTKLQKYVGIRGFLDGLATRITEFDEFNERDSPIFIRGRWSKRKEIVCRKISPKRVVVGDRSPMKEMKEKKKRRKKGGRGGRGSDRGSFEGEETGPRIGRRRRWRNVLNERRSSLKAKRH